MNKQSGEMTQKLNTSTCLKCAYLSELYEHTPKTERDYWLMTELFVILHGKDMCKGNNGFYDEEYDYLLSQIQEEYFQLHGSIGMKNFVLKIDGYIKRFLKEKNIELKEG